MKPVPYFSTGRHRVRAARGRRTLQDNGRGVDLVHVPYRANYLPDLLAGQVQVTFSPMPTAIELIRSGKLRALAMTGAMRSAALPDIPTVGDFVPVYEASGWVPFHRCRRF